MAKAARTCLIVGNWKMYKTIDQALEFIDRIAPLCSTSNCQVWLAVPFTAIKTIAEKAQGTNIVVGAQNMNDALEGAFTGEVAAVMLKDAGAKFVLLGHSERRKLFHEDDAFINRKLLRALDSDLQPLLCIGESYEERLDNHSDEVIKQQLTACLEGCKKQDVEKLIIAYEPVWAIGTGQSATVDIVQKSMKQCRAVLSELFGEKNAVKVPILYGGSVNGSNAESYLNSKEIDGLLVGSASLATDSFAKILSLRQNI